MEIHLLKADMTTSFCQDKKTALTLLLIGLCELHSNAEMFGGIESTSFKIKWKSLSKNGKRIIKYLKK